MEKQKIADLPQEEKDKIINQMKELHLGGIYTQYTVEKALAAIEKKKAQKSAEGNNPDGDGSNVTPDNPDAVKKPKNENKPAENKNASKEPKQEKEPEKEKEPALKADGICHICRSKVYNGVCSGCGFTLRR